MNIQLSLEKESQGYHFLVQLYQEGTSNFLGLGCPLSGWMLKDKIKPAPVNTALFKIYFIHFLYSMLYTY